jgi:SRSO17 transposase
MSSVPDVATAETWAEELAALHQQVGRHFYRAEPRRRALAYLRGLLSTVERKNGWQLAEFAGEATPDGIQRLLQSSRWDADAVRDDLRDYVVSGLGTDNAVVVIDETGFLKKGRKSAGVRRQYSGTAGRLENCQIGVFLAYATPQGRALIDRALYLPREWADDAPRRAEAGVPETMTFATKPQLGRQMLERLFAAGVHPAWVTADEVYGGDRSLLLWLEAQDQPYVIAIKRSEYLWYDPQGAWRQVHAVDAAATIAEGDWQTLSAGDGAKGPRRYDWARVRLTRWPRPGWDYWLLVRRSLTDPAERAYYAVFTPTGTPLEEMVWAAGARWTVEECFEAAKGEVGLDEYEVRRWDGWYRHITLALLAMAFLAVVRAQAEALPKGGTRNQTS